jgi:hypothetical protein
MKRLMLTLSSLALVGVACGGRVGLNRDEGGNGPSIGSTNDGTATGSAGKSVGSDGTSTGSGGSSGPGMVGTGKGGAASGGKAMGLPTGGTFAFGGDSGVGGAVGRFGGAGAEACALYCMAYAKVCPQAGLGVPDQCKQDCLVSLELDSASCSAGKRDAYECIGNALFQAPADCNEALAIAKQQCGGATPQVSSCNASCLPSSIYGGGGDGCHAEADCNGVHLDLHCSDTNSGDVPCTCSLNGREIWDIATGFDTSKSGCIDDQLFRLCAKELP